MHVKTHLNNLSYECVCVIQKSKESDFHAYFKFKTSKLIRTKKREDEPQYLNVDYKNDFTFCFHSSFA